MKIKIRRFSKSVLSVILAMTLIMSTMLIGTLSVNAAVTTLYVTGEAVGAWSTGTDNWKELSSKTDDGTIAYTTINGNQLFKVSTQETYDKYEGISLDDSSSLGNVTINGELKENNNLSTSGTNPTIYLCVQLATGKVYASTTEPSSGGGSTDEVTEWYMTCWYPSYATSWAISDDRKISGSEGSIEFETNSTDTCYFRMVAKLSDGTYYTYKSSDTTFSAGDSRTLTKDTKVDNTTKTDVGTQLQFNGPNSAKPYKSFAISKDASGNYILTVNESATAPTESTTAPTSKLSLSPTSANLAVGGTLTLKVTHTDCDGTVSFASNATDVAAVDATTGVVTAVAKGTATITATCTNGEKATCTVTVSTIPFAQSDRIYAYAKTLAEGETPALNAWVASETNASKINTHNDKGDVKPTLGKTSDTNIRIFLPTTASSDKVVLYNSFSSAITVNGTEIPSGEYKEVSFTPNTEYTISNGKKLTIYKSTADGALYVNNTGEFASIDDNGALSMINKLYSDKEAGEIAAGNAGALADSNGVQDVAVKKIKGRGNSTWVSANKKSFNVTFTDNINAFGFTQGKKFSLLANFKDPSLSRNKILYELADKMGVKYSPDAATVDLYLNGLYMGSYLMCQKVEVGSKELVNDLGKTLLEDLYTDSVSGTVPESAADTIKSSGFSFLIELDSNAAQGDFYTTVDSQKITIKEPEYLNDDGSIPTDAVTKAAQEFVQTKYTALNTAMSNTSITLAELNNIIDVESLAKYYLINEIAKNYDIGVSSTYLVYNYTDEKFYISPLWDMDVTTANCKVDNENYQKYDGDWTDNNSSYNLFMKKVFANPQVQSAARKLWTNSYYTTLTGYIDTLTTKATNVEGSLNCNYTKWNYPYGFQGKYDDNVQARTSLKKATYNPSDNSYTVDSSETHYATTAVGQTQFVSDWLKSRVAWMSQKYNTYTLSGLNGWSSGSAVTKSSDNGVTTWKITGASNSQFKISTDGYDGKDSTHSCINYNSDLTVENGKIVNKSANAEISNPDSASNNNFGFTVTGTVSDTSPVFLIYNQKTNTLTLSDTESTSTKPAVTLTGSKVLNENIKDGTAIALTAKITPATSNNAVVTGDYTATLYIGEKKVTAKTVTFTATDDTKDVVFDTYLEGTNQTYKVVVTCNDGEQDLTGTSNTFTYKQTGIKDQKIYFDPSTHTDASGKFDWLEATTKDSVVTATLNDGTTFKMYIDSEDVHGLDKGVFRADIDENTLAKLQSSSTTITFKMDGTSFSCSVSGQSDITSGWIYNYSSQTTDFQQRWEQYNVAYTVAYPGGCTTYAEFKKYLADQKENDTDNIVYFDNSASKFYNVYIYGWGGTGPTKDAVLMNKLPYADIWYYDFGDKKVASDFLFKDRSSYGFGNNYQQTVDLVGNNNPDDHNQCVPNGDGEWIPLNFEGTISTPNPIFITQNFYKVKEKNGTGSLKFRAFNTKWEEFFEVVKSDIQTKAVDIYFDLHDTSATDIQLYHESTNSKYKFATEFTRLTQLPGSTIYHSTIVLPYTDNGIAFKFTKFVVNSGNGHKTCTMSDKVQPSFTCINTGEVWYEINSNFDSVSNNTAKASAASVNLANAPLLAANTTDTYQIRGTVFGEDGWNSPETLDQNYGETGKIYAEVDLTKLGEFKITKNNTYYGYGDKITNISYIGVTYDNPSGLDLCEKYNGADSYNLKFTGDTGRYKVCLDTSTMHVWFEKVTKTYEYYLAGNFSKPLSHFAVYTGSGSTDYQYTFTPTDYKYNGYTVYKANATASEVENLTSYAHIVFKDKSRISNVINNQKIKDYVGQLFYLTNDSTGSWISNPTWDSTATPTISLNAASTSLTLANGTAKTALTATTTNADGAVVTYTTDPSTGASVSPDGTFTATAAGKYIVTASITVNGTTYTADVTITVSEEVIEDYCGVLAYNHSTATFDVTGGGKINNTDVILTNGYYTSGTVKTGYTTYDGTTYTVIYALTSSGKKDASTSYDSVTSHDNEGNGAGQYTFDGWTKDGVVSTENKKLTDAIGGTATVAYVANWSEEVMVTYTFTYKYDMYDTSSGREYFSDRPLIENSAYEVRISLPEDSTDEQIKDAYLANAPKISSDYFTYTFDGVDIKINEHTAVAKANIVNVKQYKVTVNSDESIVEPKDFYYQNIAEFTQEPSTGYVTVWKDEKGNILYVGNKYQFRVTRDITLTAESVLSSSLDPATYVSEPTYEFYTKNSTEYVRFNFRVDNVLAGVDPYEYGTLYFFTDENGVPVDSSISVDDNIDATKLAAAALGTASTGIKKFNATGVVNKDHKFIYAPSLKNTVANRDRYLRVYSYFIYKDENGKDVVVISSDSVVASIRNALNES